MKSRLSRLDFLRTSAVAAGTGAAVLRGVTAFGAVRSQAPVAQRRTIARGPFEPTWESLTGHYRVPEWFRDAKFGIWAHWTAQCVPEQGDWYARKMYFQGDKDYDDHVARYGHPSESGFMEMDNLWK